MKNRIQIVTWRRHGDDEEWTNVAVFAADDPTSLIAVIEADEDVYADAEEKGDYEHTYYVNDDFTFEHGEVLEGYKGRKFKISIKEVR